MMDKEILKKTKELRVYFASQHIQDCFFYISKALSSMLVLECNEVDRFEIKDALWIFIEGNVAGKSGTVYIDDFSEEFYELYARQLIESAETNERTFIPQTFTGKIFEKLSYTALDHESIQKSLQEAVLKHAKNEIKTITQSVRCTETSILLIDSFGHEIYDFTALNTYDLRVVAEKNKKMSTAANHHAFKHLHDIDFSNIIKKTIEAAILELDGKPIDSGMCPVILDAKVVSEIIHSYASLFYGTTVLSDMSILKNKLHQKIAVETFSLRDNPRYEKGSFFRQVDDEGTETKEISLIKHGVLQGFLHHRESAEKFDIPPTGHGLKLNYQSAPVVSGTNFIIDSGADSIEAMIKSLDSGIYIDKIDGAFAGINPISGDFSLISGGFLIEKGMKTTRVSEITVAGNIFTMLMDIKNISIEREASYTSLPYVLAPHLLIGALSISGK